MQHDPYDVGIIGSGPAGLQAAIHAAGKKARVIVVGKPHRSAIYKARVANYCCYEKPITGKEMLEAGRKQAEGFGAEFLEEDVIETRKDNDLFKFTTESGRTLTSRALILSIGVARKGLRVKGEKEFVGRGVSYCVDCDANFYKGMDVAVVGNESAAVSGAIALLSFARTVYLICKKLMITDALNEKLRQSEVRVLEDTWVKEIVGTDLVEAVLLKENQTLKVDGVFVELGAKGALELAAKLGAAFDADTLSFIEVNRKQETSIPGLYAAGDITGQPWQIAKAIGEGCVAGLEAAEYAKRLSG